MTEKIKNYLGWALIISVLLVGVASVWYASAYARSSEPGSYRSFGVSGEGKTVAVPDIARFSFSVVNEGGKDIGALQTANVKAANAIIDYLKQQGVDKKDISTEAYNLEPRYQTCNYSVMGGTCPPASIVGYTVRQTVSVKVRDLAKVGDILSGVVAKGANSVSQLNFTVDNPAALEAEARGEAIAQAKTKAEEIAKVGGFKLGRLLSIDDSYPQPYYGKALGMGGDMRSEAAVAAPVPTIEPGSQDLTVQVMLRYEIR